MTDIYHMSDAQMQDYMGKFSIAELKDKYKEMQKKSPIKTVIKDKGKYVYEYQDLQGGKERVYYFEDGSKKFYKKGKDNAREIEELARKAVSRVDKGEVKLTWSVPFSERFLTVRQHEEAKEYYKEHPVQHDSTKGEIFVKKDDKTSQQDGDYTYLYIAGGAAIVLLVVTVYVLRK